MCFFNQHFLLQILFICSIQLFSLSALAVDVLYCPQRQGYIKVGMSVDQVLTACGQPTAKEKSKTPMTEPIKVAQLYYTNLNTGAVYRGFDSVYNIWSLPSGSLGLTLQVDLIENKVAAIKINGSSNNAMSICKNEFIQVGDPAEKVFQYCGSPNNISENYINRPVESQSKPEIWFYQIDKFQPILSVTILDGKVKAINQ